MIIVVFKNNLLLTPSQHWPKCMAIAKAVVRTLRSRPEGSCDSLADVVGRVLRVFYRQHELPPPCHPVDAVLVLLGEVVATASGGNADLWRWDSAMGRSSDRFPPRIDVGTMDEHKTNDPEWERLSTQVSIQSYISHVDDPSEEAKEVD